MIKRLFVDHPASVGESYFAHMGVAASFGKAMLLGGLACIVHAVVPGLCVRTGSTVVADLHRRMVTHRSGPSCAQEQSNV
ncbi:DUF6356 family protein [Pseudoxanthomonas sp. CF125]|uniref:DUF6356 family protein n=1 Tax=Pseudoxanthomonas sp. CF125 TaxID=1855303 RepID=UPI00089030D6|nr:DUF6356 family protein [Pseudoxanthomonas sp. CF125]SDQ81447.1 hypothetical protein SAMN05216569_2158 [Pseudoxanthomonas sp. CF125]